MKLLTGFRRWMLGLALFALGMGGPCFSQTWDDVAQGEKNIENEFKKKIADLIVLYDGKFASLKAEKIKGFENEQEFKDRIEKATRDLTTEREKNMNPLEKAFQERLQQTGIVSFKDEKVAIDVKAIDPESKTFPITLTVGAAPLTFSINVSYSIKNSTDIKTAYYRFVDLYKARKLSAEIECTVDTAELGKSHFLYLSSWRIFETETGSEFASAKVDRGAALAWFDKLPPKALETTGRVTIRSTGKNVAEVWINSVKKGTTPLTLKQLAQGDVEYTIKWPGTSSPDEDDAVLIMLGPNPDILVTAGTNPEPVESSRTLSSQEQNRLRVLLIANYQTAKTKIGTYTVSSVERYNGFVVVSGMVHLNVVDPRGGIALRTQTTYKLSL